MYFSSSLWLFAIISFQQVFAQPWCVSFNKCQNLRTNAYFKTVFFFTAQMHETPQNKQRTLVMVCNTAHFNEWPCSLAAGNWVISVPVFRGFRAQIHVHYTESHHMGMGNGMRYSPWHPVDSVAVFCFIMFCHAADRLEKIKSICLPYRRGMQMLLNCETKLRLTLAEIEAALSHAWTS